MQTLKPSIRFKGFTDDWVIKKFSECVEIERGGSPRPIEEYLTNEPDGLNWVKIGDAPEQGNYITQTAEKIKPSGLSKTREVKSGDLILSNSMSFGRPYIMAVDGCIHDGWLLIRNNNGYFDLIFLCNMLGTRQMLNQYQKLAAGSSVHNLNKDLVGSTFVRLPKIQEQQKIGLLFEQTDKLITLYKQKYEKLTTIKKSLLAKMFPAEGESAPQIRFKGFTEPWQILKFKEVFITLSNNTLSRSELTEEKHKARNIHYGDVLIKFNECLNNIEELPFIANDSIVNNFKLSYLQKGDIIMADTAEDETVGKCTEIIDTQSEIIIAGLHTIPCRKTIDFASGYLGYYMNSSKYHDQLFPLMQGIKVTSVSKSALQDTNIAMPASLDEQNKIGEILLKTDKLITLYKKKYEKLQALKNSLLNKMFV